jgi:hypothetical protein
MATLSVTALNRTNREKQQFGTFYWVLGKAMPKSFSPFWQCSSLPTTLMGHKTDWST